MSDGSRVSLCMILFIKHIDIEGPETLGAFFSRQGYRTGIVEVWKGEPLPSDVSRLQAVVALGGPMNVYEEDACPFLKEDHVFIQRILEQNIPFLGICLGSQLLAKACGAKVYKAPEQEIGFYPVELTGPGQQDPLFAGLPERLEVFQWHGDTFDIPQGGVLLASGGSCRHQAFRIGPVAYGLQFHIEITEKSIRDWSDAYFQPLDDTHKRKKTEMLADYAGKKEKFCKTADKIYNNLLKIIQKNKVNTLS